MHSKEFRLREIGQTEETEKKIIFKYFSFLCGGNKVCIKSLLLTKMFISKPYADHFYILYINPYILQFHLGTFLKNANL